MDAVFVEAPNFTANLSGYLDDTQYAELQTHLLNQPTSGPVMPGCGGLRKLRWPDTRRGKGKRGGLRLVYLHVPEVCKFYLLDVYDKDEAEDLTNPERQYLAGVAADIKRDALQERRTP